jgi:digeranylgeranylglycerophospholipid reductase
MIRKKHDVIIIGAGPVGSYTAYLLAKEGLDVAIFEKNPSIGRDVNCSGIVSLECFRRYRLPSGAVLRSIDSIRAVSPSGNSLRYHAAAPLAYVVNRASFDQELNRMAGQEGAATYLNKKVREIAVTADSFRVKLSDEAEEACSARVGVIATGFELNAIHGILKRPMGYLYGIQTDAVMENIDDVEVYFGEKIAPGSFSWIVPVNGKSVKIGLITKSNPADFLRSFLKNPLVAQRLQSCDYHMKCSPIPVNRIPKSYAERLVIVGEAAGQVKATTGGGIYFGLLCAEIAANTIVKAFRSGNFAEGVFREYEINWKNRLEPELKAGLLLRNLFSKLSDHHIDLLIDLAKRDGILPIIKKAGFDWHKDVIAHLISHLFPKNLFKIVS